MEIWQLLNWRNHIHSAGRRDAECTGPTPTWLKIWEGYLRNEESQTHTRPPSPGFQYQEDKYPQLLAAKSSGDWVGGGGCWSPKQFLLGNPHTDSPTQTCTLWALGPGWQLEGHQWYTETDGSGIRAIRGHCSSAEPSPQKASRLLPYLRLHQPG